MRREKDLLYFLRIYNKISLNDIENVKKVVGIIYS